MKLNRDRLLDGLRLMILGPFWIVGGMIYVLGAMIFYIGGGLLVVGGPLILGMEYDPRYFWLYLWVLPALFYAGVKER